jgi:tripartite-type tricarboxylate transporter receptor subunit TctC
MAGRTPANRSVARGRQQSRLGAKKEPGRNAMLRSFACGPAVACALALAAPQLCERAQADEYPTRPVTIIVSLAPGTGMDTAVRLYGEKLAQRLGQPVVIENRPGGAGVVAGETIAKGTPDGYTLAVATSAVMAIRPTLFKQRPFDPLTDFVPISHYVKSPFVFIVNPSLPVRSVPEFIAYARERPGQLSYSSSGIGGAPHLTAELLKQKFGFDMAHVPYRNSPQSIADVAAGHVVASVAEAGASLPLIRDGKLRALAVTSATRFPTLPEVPPIGEAVGMPELEAVSWHVIFARHDTPRDIVNRLHDEMKSIMAGPRHAGEDHADRPHPARHSVGRRGPALHQGGDGEVGDAGAAIGAGRLAIRRARAQTNLAGRAHPLASCTAPGAFTLS